jgi:Ca2+-binding EF-hand superfamily protein
MEERTFVKRTQELCGGFDDMKASKVFRLAKLIDGNISTRTQLTVDEFNRFLRTHEIEYEGGHIRTEEADALGIRADIRDLFNECDIDHNESLSLHELHKALKMVGLNCSSLELKELFDMIDKNHDEKIDADEFEKVMLQKVATDLYHGHSLFHEIKKMFKILSHQKNAGITLNIMKYSIPIPFKADDGETFDQDLP